MNLAWDIAAIQAATESERMSATQGVALGSIIPGRWPGNYGVEEKDHRNIKLGMRPRSFRAEGPDCQAQGSALGWQGQPPDAA